MKHSTQRNIEVWADWTSLKKPILMGILYATLSRGKEIFSFEYDKLWLTSVNSQVIDPSLQLYGGQQYAPLNQSNFGLFLDSCPDRWGRMLMRRREAHLARAEKRQENTLLESDYLLGVHDNHRMGGLRFKLEFQGPFLDDNKEMAAPPLTSLQKLVQVSLSLERDNASSDPDYGKWLRMLIAPGGSLGGARPKASVIDQQGVLWIAKFPSRFDQENIGAWEEVAHQLARNAGIQTAETQITRFTGRHHTFLSKRFDRTKNGGRLHFASAMTLLQYCDGDDATTGVSYLELAEFLLRTGAEITQDLEELWKRIVFSICISNTDDHLRNHGFLLQSKGWKLAPAYDINPIPHSTGLKLNITENDNSLNLDLALEVAPFFRINSSQAKKKIQEIKKVVKKWPKIAESCGISRNEREIMAIAFQAID
jgi:serine/threonine-protein kinase HipA